MKYQTINGMNTTAAYIESYRAWGAALDQALSFTGVTP